MKPEIVNKISPEIALELLNFLVDLYNSLLNQDQRRAFYDLGSVVEAIAQRVRSNEK